MDRGKKNNKPRHGLFFSADILDTVKNNDSIFRQYCSNVPSQLAEPFADLVPHIKTYLRVFKNASNNTGETEVAWAILTSACLSRGAWGAFEPLTTTTTTTTARQSGGRAASPLAEPHFLLRNYEIGVMLLSTDERVLMATRNCEAPPQQHLQRQQQREVVYLPIPYELPARRYCGSMRPYMHTAAKPAAHQPDWQDCSRCGEDHASHGGNNLDLDFKTLSACSSNGDPTASALEHLTQAVRTACPECFDADDHRRIVESLLVQGIVTEGGRKKRRRKK
jgi:hypothetical protein